jgi:hypothetical protein
MYGLLSERDFFRSLALSRLWWAAIAGHLQA